MSRLGYIGRRLPLLAFGSLLVFHVAVVMFFFGMSVIFRHFNPPFTSLMLERLISRGAVPRPLLFVSIEQVPESVPAMLMKLEDKNYYRHRGIDPAAIVYAYRQNKRWGRLVMGGSTISQQLARTLFLSPDKNFLRKYVEAIAAVTLDAVVGKKRLFELYVNYIEWGKGVYGLGAAASYYYGKPAAHLSYDEYARLAAIIIDPVDYNVKNFLAHPAMSARYSILTAPPPDVKEEEPSAEVKEDAGPEPVPLTTGASAIEKGAPEEAAEEAEEAEPAPFN